VFGFFVSLTETIFRSNLAGYLDFPSGNDADKPVKKKRLNCVLRTHREIVRWSNGSMEAVS
jgi:hypothetical protein